MLCSVFKYRGALSANACVPFIAPAYRVVNVQLSIGVCQQDNGLGLSEFSSQAGHGGA